MSVGFHNLIKSRSKIGKRLENSLLDSDEGEDVDDCFNEFEFAWTHSEVTETQSGTGRCRRTSTTTPKKRAESWKNERERPRLDGNDLLHATFTRPDCADQTHTGPKPPNLFLFFFSFFIYLFFLSFLHSLTIPTGETPWRDDATAPASISLSLSLCVCLEYTSEKERSDGNGNRKKKKEHGTTHTHETPVGAERKRERGEKKRNVARFLKIMTIYVNQMHTRP